MCGTRRARSRVTVAGDEAQAFAVAFFAALEQQLHAQADAEAGLAVFERRAQRARPGARRWAAVPKAPTPGSTTSGAPASFVGSASTVHSTPTTARARVEGVQVARARVEEPRLHGSASRHALIEAQGPMVMRSASPMPCSFEKARTETPRVRS